MRRHAEQRSHARPLHLLGTHERMKVPVTGMPATVIRTFQTTLLDFGANHDSRIVDTGGAAAQDAQQELMILEGPDAVLDPLELGCEDANGVEHSSAERDVCSHQTDGIG